MDEKTPARRVVTPLRRRGAERRSRRASSTPEPDTVDVRVGGLTASYRIRYVTGPEAARIADRQARAIAALLRWVATEDHTPATPVIDLDAPDLDADDERAA